MEFCGRTWTSAAAAAALLALATVAPSTRVAAREVTASRRPAVVTRLAALSGVEAVLGILPSAAPAPFADLARGAPGRPVVAAAWTAGLLVGLAAPGSRFRPAAAASAVYLATLEDNALFPGHAPAGRQAVVARATSLGLWVARAADGVTASALADSLSVLRRDVLRRLPSVIGVAAARATVGTDVLDPLRALPAGADGRPVGLLAGERLIWHVASPAGGRDGVGVAAGAFLASRPGTYEVWVALVGGVASRPLVSTHLAIRVYGVDAAVAIHQSRPLLVADGRTVDMVRVEMVDRRGGEVLATCPGATFALIVGPGAAIQDPATGRFDRTRLRLACASGAASFLVAASAGPSVPADVALSARVQGLAAAVTQSRAVLHLVAARAHAVSLAPVPASVVAGGTVMWHVKILDQAGNPVPVGIYRLSWGAVPAWGVGQLAPVSYSAPALPDGLALPMVLPQGAPAGRWQVTVVVSGVGQASAVLRVMAVQTGNRLLARLLASVVPVAAAQASTALDPVDTILLSVVDRQGVAVPYAGSLVVALRLDGRAVPQAGLRAGLSATPGGGATVRLFGGPGSLVQPGVYTVTVGPAPGSPALAPVTVQVQVVAPPAG